MYTQPFEILHARKLRQIALVVVVVAGATDQKTAGALPHFSGGFVHGRYLPTLLQAAPIGLLDLEAIVHILIHPIFPRRLRDVIVD